MSAWILSLEPEHRKNRLAITEAGNLGDHLGSVKRSSGLRFQVFCVETFLLLPKCQSNGRDLARQCQARHFQFHSLGQQSRIEIVERSRTTAGSGSCSFEAFKSA